MRFRCLMAIFGHHFDSRTSQKGANKSTLKEHLLTAPELIRTGDTSTKRHRCRARSTDHAWSKSHLTIQV
jgi:hypothetical protein